LVLIDILKNIDTLPNNYFENFPLIAINPLDNLPYIDQNLMDDIVESILKGDYFGDLSLKGMVKKTFDIVSISEAEDLNKFDEEYLNSLNKLQISYLYRKFMSLIFDMDQNVKLFVTNQEDGDFIINYFYNSFTVFDFLKKHYKNGIGGDLALFNRDFDVETFGLTPQEKRKRGLYYFKKYFELAIGDRQIGMKRNSDGEVVAEKRFKTLQASRMDHINQLRNINNIVLYYLFGSLNRFDVKFYESNQLIQSIFRFENYLSILISLNNKFKFEEEKYFTPKSIAQEIYENYEEHFDSVKQLDFIEQELKIGNNQKHGYVVSLYFYFKKELKSAFPSAVLFQKIINNDFYLNIGRIKLSDPQNENHVLRLKEIERKWKQFSQN
jgi:hypothetical protein